MWNSDLAKNSGFNKNFAKRKQHNLNKHDSIKQSCMQSEKNQAAKGTELFDTHVSYQFIETWDVSEIGTFSSKYVDQNETNPSSQNPSPNVNDQFSSSNTADPIISKCATIATDNEIDEQKEKRKGGNKLNSNGKDFYDGISDALKKDKSIRPLFTLTRLTSNHSEERYETDIASHNENTLRTNLQPQQVDKIQKEVYSRNKEEYIKRHFTDGLLSYSCKFVRKTSNTEIIIRIHGSDNLLTLNKNNFVARIHTRYENMLNFNESFQSIKSELLNKVTIVKIFEDTALDQRNNCYRLFKEMLQNRISNSTEDIDCADDLLQLSKLFNQKFKENICLGSKIILIEIIQNKYISDILKQSADQLLNSEIKLFHRNEYLPKFNDSASAIIDNFPIAIYNIYNSGIINHKSSLKKCPSKFKRFLKLFDVEHLPNNILLSMNNKDIKLFLDLALIVDQQNDSNEAIIPQEYILNIWRNFLEKIKQLPKHESIKEFGSLTNPIYLFLFKSFYETAVEISNITQTTSKSLLEIKDGKFEINKSFDWPENTPITNVLEQQYCLIFNLLEHYEPGKYSNKESFKYQYKLKNCKYKTTWEYIKNILKTNDAENIVEDYHVWLCILDCGLSQIILASEENEIVKKLTYSLLNLFSKFLEKSEHDRHESFRIALHNIIKLAGNICKYVSDENKLDQQILEKQITLISDILVLKDNDNFNSHFANLVDVYKEYWKNREFIVGKILSKCPCKELENLMNKNIFVQLLEIVNKSLDKSVTAIEIIKYFRLYNEFLQHFKDIEFEWLVSERSLFNDSFKNHVMLVDENKKYYRVTDPEEFSKAFEAIKMNIPEHYLITVITELLCIINKSLDKRNWSESNRLNAAGDLFLAIGHSLIHLRDQTNYVDFDNFVRNCSFPFDDVLMNSQTYPDFKARLDNIENFYLYTNKQKEISIDNALNLCAVNSETSISNDFNIDIDHSLLKDCYERYSIKYFSLEKYINTSDTYSVITDMRKYLDNVSPILEWSPEFKTSTVPLLLANLAAVWTIMESKDLVRIGKRMEPHVIQILCILRLLSVDKKSDGIDKHMAQVLTGQGKSIVLGLLSSLLAVTGNNCTITCYSEYLANRDKGMFKKFFDIFSEFDMKGKVSYRTIDDVISDYLLQNINGVELDLRNLVTKLILDELPIRIHASDRKPKSTILLIDEVDVFFSDTFYGNVYRGGSKVPFPALLEIQPKIWEIVEEGMYEKHIVLDRIMGYINKLLQDDKFEDFKDFMESNTDLFKNHLMDMVTTAIAVSKFKIVKNSFYYEFKINTEGLITLREENGIYSTCRFVGYYNIFYYFLLKEMDYEHKNYSNYGYLAFHCGKISYAELPNEFPLILGVSGTLTTLHDYEKSAIKSYGINTLSVMPSFFGDRKLRFDPFSDCILKETESEWIDSIYDSVNEKIQNGRALIVFFDTEHEINLFDVKYRSRINRLHKLTGNEEPSTLEWYISESGVAQTVTLATRLMGRGVDFKSNDLSVEHKGGVHVIQSFFSLDVKEEVQIQGRTARKDNKGSYELILYRNQLAKINSFKKEKMQKVSSYSELCDVRRKVCYSKGIRLAEKIKQAAEKHDLTMKFLKSFGDYTPNKRMEYFSRYPFVKLEK